MQTFVPYPDFPASAVVLDSRRLGKQRVETFQILRALTWPKYGWKNHPAARMWRGFVPALVCYGLATCDEWEARGHADATRRSLLEFTGGQVPVFERLVDAGQVPPWMGSDPVHRSHQSALVRKEPEHYRQYFPDVPDDLPYVWPSAAFPRWPLRRPSSDALSLDEALALLGYSEPTEEQRAAVTAATQGRSLHLQVPQGAGATTAGLLAALCTPGRTVWITSGPALSPMTPPQRRETPAPAAPGKVSASIARPPDPDAAASMAAEAGADPEFRFLRPGPLTHEQVQDASLVVVDHDAGDVPDVGLPVLRLETLPPDTRTDTDTNTSADTQAEPDGGTVDLRGGGVPSPERRGSVSDEGA